MTILTALFALGTAHAQFFPPIDPCFPVGCAPLEPLPDLTIVDVIDQCDGNGELLLTVVVKNSGLGTAPSARVDLWFGEDWAPPMGSESTYYAYTPSLSPGMTASMHFEMPNGLFGAQDYIDAIVDTHDFINEIDDSVNSNAYWDWRELLNSCLI